MGSDPFSVSDSDLSAVPVVCAGPVGTGHGRSCRRRGQTPDMTVSSTPPFHDVARIGHAELLTPKPEESLRFFVDVLGMEEEARQGQSVYLRGWGDYLRYSLKLTESPQGGLGHMALRTWGPEALERRAAAIGQTGLGRGWIDGDVGHGPAYQFEDPDGHHFELYYEAERYVAPEHLKPSWRNQ